jgi:hypothetical protein
MKERKAQFRKIHYHHSPKENKTQVQQDHINNNNLKLLIVNLVVQELLLAE